MLEHEFRWTCLPTFQNALISIKTPRTAPRARASLAPTFQVGHGRGQASPLLGMATPYCFTGTEAGLWATGERSASTIICSCSAWYKSDNPVAGLERSGRLITSTSIALSTSDAR